MQIPGYRLGRKIFSGDFCATYSAVDIATSRTVMIWLLDPALLDDKTFIESFKKLTIPQAGRKFGLFVTIKQAVIGPEGCYMVTDYLPAPVDPARDTYIFQFPVVAILQWGQQLADSLTLMHKKGFVHGGISLANVFMTADYGLLLGPGGFSKHMSDTRHNKHSRLSMDELNYLAPEAHQGLTPASDFYALGVLLYEMIFGQKPFHARTHETMIKKKLLGVYEIEQEDKQDLLVLFQRMLHPRPETRICDGDQFFRAVGESGIRIKRKPVEQAVRMPEPENRAEPGENGSQSQSRTALGGMVRTLTVLLALGFTGYFLYPHIVELQADGSPAVTPLASNRIDKPEVAVSSLQPDANTGPVIEQEPQSQEQVSQIDQYQLSANQLLNEGKPGSALIAINSALELDETNSVSLEIKAAIQEVLEIESLFNQADEMIQQGNLTRPVGESAIDRMQQLSERLGADDSRVREGFDKIGNVFVFLAETAIEQGDAIKADQLAKNGLDYLPGHRGLNDFQSKLEAIQENVGDEVDPELTDVSGSSPLNNVTGESSVVSGPVEGNQESEPEQQLEQLRQQNIEQRFASAYASLQTRPMTAQLLLQAVQQYEQLVDASVENTTRLEWLKERILQEHLDLAVTLGQQGNRPAALAIIDQGLNIESQQAKLIELKASLNSTPAITEQ